MYQLHPVVLSVIARSHVEELHQDAHTGTKRRKEHNW